MMTPRAKRTLATALGAFLIGFGVTSFVKRVGAEENCIISSPVINGTTATFTVSGDCTVTLVSYQRNGKGTLAEQTLHDATTKEFSCTTDSVNTARNLRPTGERGVSATSSSASAASGLTTCHFQLTGTVPECPWQVDLILGRPRTPPDYGRLPGELLGFRLGGTGECQTPSTTTTTPSATSTTTTASAPTTVTTSAPSPTTTTLISATANSPTTSPPIAGTGTPSTPTELPNTGAGLLGLTLVALGCIGTGRYVEWRGKRRAR